MICLKTILCAAAVALPGTMQDGSGSQMGPVDPVRQQLAAAFLEKGLHLDFEHGAVAFEVRVEIRDDLLEYLLVNPYGAVHESMLVADVVPSELNAALLALGVTPGTNASWHKTEPEPGSDEPARHTVQLPKGDTFFPYLAWSEEGETYFYRVEDLLRNLETGRSMRRHGWVYLGSRMMPPRDGKGPEVFAADVEANLINVAFFPLGNTLVTTALEACRNQTIWLPNAWLLPERGSRATLVLARERLVDMPAGVSALVGG